MNDREKAPFPFFKVEVVEAFVVSESGFEGDFSLGLRLKFLSDGIGESGH